MKKLLLFVAALLFVANSFAQFTVHLKSAIFTEAPMVWAWDAAANYSGGAWPGVAADGPDANGFYSFTFPAEAAVASTQIIFSAAGNPQTANIVVAAETWLDWDGTHQGAPTVVDAPTALPSISADKTSVVVSGSSVKVSGEGSSVEIVSISGVSVQVAQLEGEFVSNPLSAGVYIVKVDGTATKVLVK